MLAESVVYYQHLQKYTLGKLKITKMSNSGWRVLEKSGLPWENTFYSRRYVEWPATFRLSVLQID